MDREITMKLQEVFQKCQAWVDDEKYIPKKFKIKNWSEEFTEKIRRELENEMIKQKFGFGNNKIYLPSKYSVQISQEDSHEFSGIKRELLVQALNKFVERCFRILSINYHDHNFVQVYAFPNLQRGEIKIVHQWEESYTPKIRFNQQPQTAKSGAFEKLSEDTIIAPAFWENNCENMENDYETVIRKKLQKFYSLEIWRDGTRQNSLPIFQPEITLGRGSPSICVDVPLEGDLQISRRHATLKYQTNCSFQLSVSGQNPVIIGDKPLFAGQTATLDWEENFQIGSYLLKMQR